MYLIAIAWLYVAVMMALAEATHAQGSVLGAIITFMLYGLAPVALVMYLLGTPSRRRARKQMESAAAAEAAPGTLAADPDPGPDGLPAVAAAEALAGVGALAPDGRGQPATAAVQAGVAPEREKP